MDGFFSVDDDVEGGKKACSVKAVEGKTRVDLFVARALGWPNNRKLKAANTRSRRWRPANPWQTLGRDPFKTWRKKQGIVWVA